ncbi:hypothetical protein Lal_00000979 [Lupinus albus]|nr:hypothetical protein Lal_00000979 [Lupinus albus]
MDSLTLQMATSQLVFSPNASTVASLNNKNINFRSNFKGGIITKIHVVSPNGSASCNVSKKFEKSFDQAEAREIKSKTATIVKVAISSLCFRLFQIYSLMLTDAEAIREEIIEKPVGLSLAEKVIGNNHRCADCQAKGAVLCATCAGSGLYIDSILESQGIIVKVRCLGCGGTGNMMCTECGGRGHLGLK